MYFNKLILGLMIAFAIQTLSIKPAWAIKKRLQSTHAERLSKLTNDPLESADFLNSGWLHEASIAVLDKKLGGMILKSSGAQLSIKVKIFLPIKPLNIISAHWRSLSWQLKRTTNILMHRRCWLSLAVE